MFIPVSTVSSLPCAAAGAHSISWMDGRMDGWWVGGWQMGEWVGV